MDPRPLLGQLPPPAASPSSPPASALHKSPYPPPAASSPSPPASALHKSPYPPPAASPYPPPTSAPAPLPPQHASPSTKTPGADFAGGDIKQENGGGTTGCLTVSSEVCIQNKAPQGLQVERPASPTTRTIPPATDGSRTPPPPPPATATLRANGGGSRNSQLLPVTDSLLRRENGNPSTSGENTISFREWYESCIGDLLDKVCGKKHNTQGQQISSSEVPQTTTS